jgi:peptidoglycan/xylan/chitin deacetylase (PgdA/CDA1 family)
MTRRLCSISVDLDETPNYFQIHDLPPPDPISPGAHAVYDAALPRLARFADAEDHPLTLFAIGQDLARPANARALRDLCDRGHAVENHSFSHPYDLTRLPPKTIEREIEDGARAILEATGRRPSGFRAPGYAISDPVLDALETLGARFDSSVFPCPPYYSAKALVMGAMRLTGRHSRAVLDSPRVLTAPARPYRPGRPWHRRGNRPVVELPIQVTPILRLPVIGTSVGLAGPTIARLLAKMCSREPFVNLELHGMDVLSPDDGLADLVPRQPELRTPLDRRLRALSAFVDTLRSAGFAFVRLDEAAEELRRSL